MPIGPGDRAAASAVIASRSRPGWPLCPAANGSGSSGRPTRQKRIRTLVRFYRVDACTPWRPIVQTPQQLTIHRLQFLLGLLLLAISLGGLVLLLALYA
jgi:hypothetical protein